MDPSEGSRETQLGSQMERLEKAIVNTKAGVENLRARLRPFLRIEPAAKVETDVPEQELVPFANEVRCKAEDVERLAAQLDLTMSELEL